jgi:hypothetical protein
VPHSSKRQLVTASQACTPAGRRAAAGHGSPLDEAARHSDGQRGRGAAPFTPPAPTSHAAPTNPTSTPLPSLAPQWQTAAVSPSCRRTESGAPGPGHCRSGCVGGRKGRVWEETSRDYPPLGAARGDDEAGRQRMQVRRRAGTPCNARQRTPKHARQTWAGESDRINSVPRANCSSRCNAGQLRYTYRSFVHFAL